MCFNISASLFRCNLRVCFLVWHSFCHILATGGVRHLKAFAVLHVCSSSEADILLLPSGLTLRAMKQVQERQLKVGRSVSFASAPMGWRSCWDGAVLSMWSAKASFSLFQIWPISFSKPTVTGYTLCKRLHWQTEQFKRLFLNVKLQQIWVFHYLQYIIS